VGGSEWQFAQLAVHLAQRGHRVGVVTLFPDGGFRDYLEANPCVELHSLYPGRGSRLGRKVQWFRANRGICHYLRRFDAEVLYTSDPAMNLLGWRSARRTGVPIVWSVRGYEPDPGLRGAVMDQLGRILSRSVPCLISNSQECLRHYQQLAFAPKRSAVIPNGIDAERFAPRPAQRAEARRRWGIPDATPVVGTVARISAIKGYSTFLRAARKLADQREDVRFVCVGPDILGIVGEYERLTAELDLRDRVLWAGRQTDVEVAYNGFDVATLASLRESFPNAVAEAMACGVPCVATDAGDARQIVGDAGIIVPPGDPDALAEGWARLLDDPETRTAFGTAGRQHILSTYSIDVLLDRTEQALRTVANGR
jgi:glycosyltransferase involved in cell wall biosynthesis